MIGAARPNAAGWCPFLKTSDQNHMPCTPSRTATSDMSRPIPENSAIEMSW
jgi:hypothetical protein